MSATPNINLLKIKGNKFDATTAPTSTDDSSALETVYVETN